MWLKRHRARLQLKSAFGKMLFNRMKSAAIVPKLTISSFVTQSNLLTQDNNHTNLDLMTGKRSTQPDSSMDNFLSNRIPNLGFGY